MVSGPLGDTLQTGENTHLASSSPFPCDNPQHQHTPPPQALTTPRPELPPSERPMAPQARLSRSLYHCRALPVVWPGPVAGVLRERRESEWRCALRGNVRQLTWFEMRVGRSNKRNMWIKGVTRICLASLNSQRDNLVPRWRSFDRCFTLDSPLDPCQVGRLLFCFIMQLSLLYTQLNIAMSLDALIFRPLLLLIHTTDILISHISSLLPSPDNSVSTDRVPRHVAFSFITEGNVEDVNRRLGVIIGDLASWAAEVGVEEVSLWNEAGTSSRLSYE